MNAAPPHDSDSPDEARVSFGRRLWYFFGPFTFRRNNQARWQAARYEEIYARVDGVWKIRRLTVRGPRMSADYEKGWARPESAG